MTLLELALASITATIVIASMLGVALDMYRKRVPDAGWVDDLPRTPEQRYREVEGHE